MSQVAEGPDESTEAGDATPRGRRSLADRTPPGCIIKPTIVAVAALAAGTYLITSNKLGSGARVGGIALIFIGAVLSLPALVICFGMAVQWYFTRKLTAAVGDFAEAGRKMVQQNKALWVERFEYRDATEADFRPLDRDWYGAMTDELQRLGYRNLGDIVNVTIERTSGVSPVIRRLLSGDGTTAVGIYHLVMPGGARQFYIIDAESEFSDGSFLLTNNTAESDQTTTPPMIQRQRLPSNTPLEELLRRHESQKVSTLAAKPGLSCTVMATADDVMEFQQRQQAIKAAFRKGIGYVDPEEVRRIADRKPNLDEATKAAVVASAELARREAQAEDGQ